MNHLVGLLLLLCAAVGEAQITCVSSCESSSEIAVVTNIRECCIDSMGGGFRTGPSACSSCNPFRVVDPQISFTFDPESPIVGDPFTATCSAEISPEVTGSIQLEWRNEVGATIATSGGNNSAVVSFTIESYSMDDGTVIGGFNCRAAILAEDEMRNYEIVLGRNILFTSSSSSTSITSCGDFTEGSDFQLTCTVTGVTNTSPMILWFGPPGRPTFSSNGVEVGDIVAMGNTYSRSLRFPSLSPQHAGRYICMNSVTSRPTVEHQLFLADRSVVTTDPVALGRPFAARCRVTVPTELSATVQTILLGPEDTQLASDIGVSRAEAVFLLPSLQESDLGQYKCRSSVFSNQLNTPVMAEQSFSINIERCATSPAKCTRVPNAECQDSSDGPVCLCRSGFLKVVSRCMNKNECRMNLHNCSENALCFDTPGSFFCLCRPGFSGDGVQCADINECVESASACGPSEICVNTDGSFTCSEVILEPQTVNECEMDDGPCDANAVCTDTIQSFNCTCNEGYTGDGDVCTDIDECDMGMDDCDENANCINLQGAYLCRCRDGYFGTGYTCKPFQEEPTVVTTASDEPTVETPVSDEPTVETPVSDEPTVCAEIAPQEDMPHSHSHHTRSRHTHSHYSHTRTNTPTAQQPPCGNSNPINDEEDTTMRRTRTRTTPRSNTRPTDVQQEEASSGTDSTSQTQRPSNRGSSPGTPRGRSRGTTSTPGRQTSTTSIAVQDSPITEESEDSERSRHRTRTRGHTRTRHQQAPQPQGATEETTTRRKSRKRGRSRG